MKKWLNNNLKLIIIASFLIPIVTVAVVSISHVTKWYGISNPISWAIYLSIGIEIAALSALAALTVDLGKKVYFPFIMVTFIQFIGNVFFSYEYINILSNSFLSWVELVSPLMQFVGIESTDLIGHKRILSLLTGGLLPIISLTFLHMLVKFTEEERQRTLTEEDNRPPIAEDKSTDIVGEISRVRLTDDELNKIEDFLLNKTKPEHPPEIIVNPDEKKKTYTLTDAEFLHMLKRFSEEDNRHQTIINSDGDIGKEIYDTTELETTLTENENLIGREEKSINEINDFNVDGEDTKNIHRVNTNEQSVFSEPPPIMPHNMVDDINDYVEVLSDRITDGITDETTRSIDDIKEENLPVNTELTHGGGLPSLGVTTTTETTDTFHGIVEPQESTINDKKDHETVLRENGDDEIVEKKKFKTINRRRLGNRFFVDTVPITK